MKKAINAHSLRRLFIPSTNKGPILRTIFSLQGRIRASIKTNIRTVVAWSIYTIGFIHPRDIDSLQIHRLGISCDPVDTESSFRLERVASRRKKHRLGLDTDPKLSPGISSKYRCDMEIFASNSMYPDHQECHFRHYSTLLANRDQINRMISFKYDGHIQYLNHTLSTCPSPTQMVTITKGTNTTVQVCL